MSTPVSTESKDCVQSCVKIWEKTETHVTHTHTNTLTHIHTHHVQMKSDLLKYAYTAHSTQREKYHTTLHTQVISKWLRVTNTDTPFLPLVHEKRIVCIIKSIISIKKVHYLFFVGYVIFYIWILNRYKLLITCLSLWFLRYIFSLSMWINRWKTF